MKASLAELQSAIVEASMIGDATFDGVTTDSRSAVAGNLFVALRGERFDAHDFLADVVAKDVAAVVVERIPKGLTIPALVVPDTRAALQAIGRYWRQQFSFPMIGVTGSNGKTTVKEMIAAILANAFGEQHCLATRGNLNNDIGVPLTLLRLQASHQAAVIELGMNHPGEIALLAGIARPTLGLVNNAQREHQEFMASVEAVAKENGAVLDTLQADGIAVFPADDPFTSLWRDYAERSGQRKIVTFGLSGNADVTCDCQPNAFGSNLEVRIGDQQFAVRLAAAGLHNVRNALAAIACTFAIGIPLDAIVRGIESFVPVNGRLQRKTARNGATIIDDTYNANPDSVRAAIDVLAQAKEPRVLVLGDMGEVGSEGQLFHEEIGAYASDRNITRLFTYGKLARHASDAFGASAKHHDDLDSLTQALEAVVTDQATVLVKGSRFMKMERLVHHLVSEQPKESH
jgi:UDP-N-acetylmuramoyl-tripeptide--D-alanyl-D-alanine ligase